MRAQLRRARGFMTEETVLRTGEVELDLGARRCTIDGREVDLTRREFDLLGALLRYPGRIHTREQLLGLVWGADDITPKTVDVHVAALRRKLGSAVSIATLRGRRLPARSGGGYRRAGAGVRRSPPVGGCGRAGRGRRLDAAPGRATRSTSSSVGARPRSGCGAGSARSAARSRSRWRGTISESMCANALAASHTPLNSISTSIAPMSSRTAPASCARPSSSPTTPTTSA